MAEIETALPPTERSPMANHHKRESTHRSNNEKPAPEHDHRGTKPALEAEELTDLYDPNMYGGTLRLNFTPYLHKFCSTPRSDPFPVDPNALEETHQLTIRALVVGAILGAIGK